jgi:hypothetical protein
VIVAAPVGLPPSCRVTFGWSLVTVVAPRAVDDEVEDDGIFDDE